MKQFLLVSASELGHNRHTLATLANLGETLTNTLYLSDGHPDIDQNTDAFRRRVQRWAEKSQPGETLLATSDLTIVALAIKGRRSVKELATDVHRFAMYVAKIA